MSIFFCFAALFFFQAQTKNIKNTFGDIHRRQVLEPNVAERMTGRLVSPTGKFCTASLVAENLIVTAAHCVVFEWESEKPYRFEQEHMGTSALVVRATWGAAIPGQEGPDWAVLEIDQQLGKEHGYFRLEKIDTSVLELRSVSLSGYGTSFWDGRSLTTADSCSIRKYVKNERVIYHDCDASRGDSGGPIYQCSHDDCQLIGITNAENRDGGDVSLDVEEYEDR